MATGARDHATHRTVVLLRPSEKQRLQKLAREENVSSSEIVRRSILAYQTNSRDEQAEYETVVAEMNLALDKALDSVRSARLEVAENLAQMKRRAAQS